MKFSMCLCTLRRTGAKHSQGGLRLSERRPQRKHHWCYRCSSAARGHHRPASDWGDPLDPLDVRTGVPHLHREPTEQRAAACAIAGLGCLLQRRGGGANSGRTDSLRGALELVRDRSQFRKIAGARGRVDLPFRINCCFAESPQQRINCGAVLAQPGRQHVSVDSRGGLLLVCRIADARLLLDRQPAFQRRAQLRDAHRLRQIGIHAGCQAALFLGLHGIRSNRNDRRADGAMVGFGGA